MDNDAKSVFYRLLEKYKESKSEADFSNLMLNAWITIESYINNLYLEGLGVNPFFVEKDIKHNELVAELENTRFEDKLRFIVKKKIITNKQEEGIRSFQHERNRLFHASKKNNVWSKLYNRAEQQRLIDIAKLAFDIIWEVVTKYYRSKYPLPDGKDLEDFM